MRQVLCAVLMMTEALGADPMVSAWKPVDPAIASSLIGALCPAGQRDGRMCRTCPEGTSLRGKRFPWELQSSIVGHFTAPKLDEAIVKTTGCEPHSFNFGGGALLRRSGSAWKVVWYRPDFPTGACRTLSVKGRDLLLCRSTFGGQGARMESLVTLDLAKPGEKARSSVLELIDTSHACGLEEDLNARRVVSEIKQVVVTPENTLRVTVAHGKRQWTKADWDACEHKREMTAVPTAEYHLEYSWNGDSYEPSVVSVPILKSLR